MTVIIGFDLALVETGWAAIDTKAYIQRWGTWKAPPPRHPLGQRLCHIANEIEALILSFWARAQSSARPTVFFEGAVGASFQVLKLAPVHGVFHETMWRLGIVPVEVAPTTIKVLATGEGTADKLDMVQAARTRLNYTGMNNNEADALWVADFGARILGHDCPPLPPEHLRALHLEEPT